MRAPIAATLFLAMSGLTTAPATAEPVIKIINFTADWCPNCRILDPRIAEALKRFEAGDIDYIELDMTYARGVSDEERLAVYADAIRLADSHQAGYLWDWYGGVTGLSAIIAADNGEPISCLNRSLSVDQIAFRLNEAQILARKAPAGARKPDGPDCPPPLN